MKDTLNIEQDEYRKQTEETLAQMEIARERLLESQARLESLVGSIDEIVFEFDEQGTYLNIWTANDKILFRAKSELIGKKISDFFGEEFTRSFVERFKRILETGKPETMEYEMEVQEGKRWFLGRISRIGSAAGAPKTVCMLARDITERKQMMEALKESETFLNDAQKLAHVGSWHWDIATNDVTWSEELYNIFGLRPENFGASYEAFLQTVHEEDRAFVKGKVDGSYVSHEPFTYHCRIVRPDGTIRITLHHGDVVVGEDGRAVRMYGTTQDVTKSKDQEEKLERSLSALRAIVDSTADGLLVVDNHGKIITYNHKFIQMWGVPDSVIATKDDNKALEFALGQLKDPEDFLKKVRELYALPDAESYDEIDFKDGRIIERYSQPQRLGNESIGRVWSFRDVTDQRNFQEKLAAKAQELARSNADLDQFASAASHDLKEPLRSVASYLQLLEKKYLDNLDQDGKKYILRAVSASVRMQTLIEDLLRYARLGIKEQGLVEVDSSVVFRRMVEILRPYIDEAGAKVKAGPLPKVEFVESDLLQIFQNLVGNAIKFRSKDPPMVEVSARKDEGSWTFMVKDNGIGIEPQYFDQIFKVFNRLHSQRHYPGTGIGLAICKKIVEYHDGKIWLESEPGKGSAFYFTIPEKGGKSQ